MHIEVVPSANAIPVRGPTLVGRQREPRRIDELLAAARRSRSAVLLISGEAGSGKSALLDAARERAADLQVLACRGAESESRLPFAALHQLLRPVLGHADAIPAVQAHALYCALGLEARTRPERFLVSLAALSVLAEAAAQRPLLCLVDDAQWIDGASADVLRFVARRLDLDAIAMLVAARDDDRDCVRPLGPARMQLAGVDADGARELIARGARGPVAPSVADWLVGATRGNPLALLELSAGLGDAQRGGIDPILGPVAISVDVERAFLERVRRLPDAGRQLLLIAAADDAGDLTTVLDAAARLGVGTEALDDAERIGLIRVRGMRLELRHPLVGSAVYQGAPLSRRRAAHAALAAVLTGDSRADRRAWHRAAASVSPDPAVVEELEGAAGRAHARGGHDAASLALERASALASDDQERARLLTAAAESAWLPGHAARALALLRRARSLPGAPCVRADASRLLGLIELTSGVPAESTRILLESARGISPADPERALYLLSLASWGAAIARDRAAVVAIADEAERLRVADGPAARFLLGRLAGLRAHFNGDFDEAAAHFRAALDLAEGDAAARLPDRLGLLSPVGLFLCDDRSVIGLHRRTAVQARADGMVTVLAQALPWVALGEIWGGRCPAADASLAEGHELARGTGQDQIACHLVAIQALLAAVRGDEARCRALAAESLERASAGRLVHVTCCATWALEVLELGLGHPEAALAHARALPPAAGVDWDALDRIEAAVHAGEPRSALAWLDEFEQWACSSRAPWGQAVAAHCRALLATDPREAEALFANALAMHERAGRPFERARTELALGELLRRGRRRSEARSFLRAALERFEAVGSTLWADRARAELRATGETARKRDPSTLDQLTAQEVRIAQLVAEGRTNRDVAGRLFLSPRTIDFHLRNVFRKLDITSRVELARMDLAQATAGER